MLEEGPWVRVPLRQTKSDLSPVLMFDKQRSKSSIFNTEIQFSIPKPSDFGRTDSNFQTMKVLVFDVQFFGTAFQFPNM